MAPKKNHNGGYAHAQIYNNYNSNLSQNQNHHALSKPVRSLYVHNGR